MGNCRNAFAVARQRDDFSKLGFGVARFAPEAHLLRAGLDMGDPGQLRLFVRLTLRLRQRSYEAN